MTAFSGQLEQVSSLYIGYFGRAGDPAGENYWIGQLNAETTTLAQIAGSFATQPEATGKYPYLANPSLGDPSAFVDRVYENLFNHGADAAGKAYWVDQLQTAGGSASMIGQFILNVISGAAGADDAAIRNKVDSASGFAPDVATQTVADQGTDFGSPASPPAQSPPAGPPSVDDKTVAIEPTNETTTVATTNAAGTTYVAYGSFVTGNGVLSGLFTALPNAVVLQVTDDDTTIPAGWVVVTGLIHDVVASEFPP